MKMNDFLIKNFVYKDCAEICKRAKFTEKWIEPQEKYKELVSLFFLNENNTQIIIGPIAGWAGYLGLMVSDKYKNVLWKELESEEFKETKIVLQVIGSKDQICDFIMGLCVLNHALDGIGSIIKGKKLEFGLIVTIVT